MPKKYSFLIVVIISTNLSFAQMMGQFGTSVNTNCLGQPCNYEGPSILINELMISPLQNDGSISGPGIGLGRGEWIELYNPNLCEPVDISCYYLGNYTYEGQGGVRLPDNLIVPPGGFVMVRGINVPPVPANLLVANGGNVLEVVVPAEIWLEGVCLEGWGNRIWFPNAGGWFAFYDDNGVAQDAVSWGPSNGTDMLVGPCSPATSSCPNISELQSYNDIPDDRKFYASPLNASSHQGNSIRRMPDGGAWDGNGVPTYAVCNSLPCATVGESTCTGTATILVTGGQPPYSFVWSDSQLQMTQTAVGLCAGDYQVTVTDNSGLVQVFEVTVQDYVPPVTLNVASEYCVYDADVNLTNYSPIAESDEFGEITGAGIANTTFSPDAAGVGTHIITYTFIDANGCMNSASDEIVVHPIPEVSVNLASEFCTYDPITVMTNVTPAPTSGGVGVLVGAGINGFEFNPALAGPGTHILTYTFTSIYGCVNSATDQVVVYQVPTVNFTASPTIGPESLEVDFINSSSGASSYNWTFGDGQSASGDFVNYTHIYQEYGNYIVTVIASENGCSDTATMLIQVLINPITYDIPNVFTPNGDNTNQFFTLINPIGFNRVEEFEVLILNRWGQLIRTFNNYDFGWDGKDENGNDMVEGVYYYKLYIRSVFGEIFENHGFFHLIRE
jgi:gliding motility-associated-like protein